MSDQPSVEAGQVESPRRVSRIAKRHPDCEWYDTVTIETVPRFKTSDFSGDEWRTSARMRVWRKGMVIGEKVVRDIQTAAAFLPGFLIEVREDHETAQASRAEDRCFQPGCVLPAVSEYELKAEYTRDGSKREGSGYARYFRRFCRRHLERGDAGLEDGDHNYTVVSGPGPDEAMPHTGDESPSAGPFWIGADPDPDGGEE